MSGDGFETQHWPLEIRLKRAERLLEIDFDDGSTFRLPAEYLRVESPSAEVQGHSPSQKQLVYGKAGGAFTDNKLDVSCNGDAFFSQGGCSAANNQNTAVQDEGVTAHQFGWAVGAGFELALTPAWSAKELWLILGDAA